MEIVDFKAATKRFIQEYKRGRSLFDKSCQSQCYNAHLLVNRLKKKRQHCRSEDMVPLLSILSEATFLLHDNDDHTTTDELDAKNSKKATLISILYHHLPITGLVDLVIFEYLNSGVHGFGLELITSLVSSGLNLRGQPLQRMKALVDAIGQVADVTKHPYHFDSGH
jgi:hypothetical protein